MSMEDEDGILECSSTRQRRAVTEETLGKYIKVLKLRALSSQIWRGGEFKEQMKI